MSPLKSYRALCLHECLQALKVGARLVDARIPSFSRFGQTVAGLTIEFPFASSPAHSAPSDAEDGAKEEAQV